MKKSALLAGAVALALGGVAHADVYGPGPGGVIPDRGTLGIGAPQQGVFTSTINVPDNLPVLSLNSVTLNFPTFSGAGGEHSWVGDLVVRLIGPGGQDVHLFARPEASTSSSFGNSNDMNGGPYVFVNSGGANFPPVAVGGNLPPGTYNRSTSHPGQFPPGVQPDADDYTVFNGTLAGGLWTLEIGDWAGGDTGGLENWSLDVTLVPEPGSLGLLAAGAILPLLRRRRK